MGGHYNNEAFLSRLEASKSGVWQIARWLSDRGHHVKVNAVAGAPSVGERYSYTDGGDLEIAMRVEVKQLSAEFTCRSDFPFPEILVCNRGSWDAAVPKPYAFYYLSKDGSSAALIEGSDSKDWWLVERQQKGHPYPSEFYAAKLEQASFFSLK